MQGVRMGNWKAVKQRNSETWELYDLSKDIGEKNNIAENHPKIVQKIDSWVKVNRVAPREQKEPAKPKGKRFR